MNDLDSIISSLKTIIASLEAFKVSNPKVSSLSVPPVELSEFEALKNLLNSNDWPVAADPDLICDMQSENEKAERGRGIVDMMIEQNLSGLKFLDFGCGEGHATRYALERGASLAVGFDIKEQWKKSDSDKLIYTSDFEEVVKNGPYDAVLMFDVLDHLKNETPVDVLKKIYASMTAKGLLYCYVHPFTSRHATHLYNHLNKAYLHLVFTPEELSEILPGVQGEPNYGIKYPLKEYAAIFTQGGFHGTGGGFQSKKEHIEPAEDFFKRPSIINRIRKNTGMTGFPEYQLSVQGIEYTLRKT